MAKTARIVSKDAAATAVEQDSAPDAAQLQDRSPAPIPLVAHLIYRLDVGGLENGLVKDQLTLVQAFLCLLEQGIEARAAAPADRRRG